MITIHSLPPYSEVIQSLKTLGPEQLQNFYATVAKGVSKPDTRKQLLSKVRELAEDATRIDNAFDDVRFGLKVLEKEDDQKLLSRWEEFHNVRL